LGSEIINITSALQTHRLTTVVCNHISVVEYEVLRVATVKGKVVRGVMLCNCNKPIEMRGKLKFCLAYFPT
jgi:hypothetical protein